jgi:predicted ATP-dependent serine protease
MDITAMQNVDIEIIDDKYSLTDILLYAESRKPDVVFIDFVQNIRTDNKDEYSAMTEVAIKIQQLAIKNNIAVFDLSQISND